ncbi:hypothetical protein CC86DRAFT_419014 [Ophiobolus disseminans]|uniref:SGNH hydrolase n=1 Tax=Ophiobolus disseminans TaxID=1469910 RepID=A0A6A6ZXA6_9PLEO|nr:hypothetical protein CC86DRAFT_419014 [Ophiobolus disseminans]
MLLLWSALVAPLLAFPTENLNPRDVFLQKRSPSFEWTAWGDSNASGVGNGRYLDGRRYLRYIEAYSQWINDDPKKLLPGSGGKFNIVVCSGSTAEEVLEFQFYDSDQKDGKPNWQYYPRPAIGKPTIGTLTVGGDDVDFPGILNNCILEGFPWPLSQGFTPRTCDEQRALSWSLIAQDDSRKTPKNDLVAKIDAVIKKIVTVGKKNIGSFKLYVTGYGQFFNAEDPYCDTVTFARSANPGRRFCEPGVKEPDQDNPNAGFLHYPYDVDETNPGIAYLNQVAKRSASSLSWDPKQTLWRDYMNDFWSKVDEGELKKAIGGNVSAKYNFWFDTIGYRARIFHPSKLLASSYYEAIVNQYSMDAIEESEANDREKTKAVEIILRSSTAKSNQENQWFFYETPAGTSARCKPASSTLAKFPLPNGPIEPEWPNGEFPIRPYGMNCMYKNNNKNAGALWCKERKDPIICKSEKHLLSELCMRDVIQKQYVSCQW